MTASRKFSIQHLRKHDGPGSGVKEYSVHDTQTCAEFSSDATSCAHLRVAPTISIKMQMKPGVNLLAADVENLIQLSSYVHQVRESQDLGKLRRSGNNVKAARELIVMDTRGRLLYGRRNPRLCTRTGDTIRPLVVTPGPPRRAGDLQAK